MLLLGSLDSVTVGRIVVLFWGLVILAIVVWAVVLMFTEKKRRIAPIVCVCRNGLATAFVLKSDFDRCAAEYWDKMQQGLIEDPTRCESTRGHRIPVTPVFTFETQGEAHCTLVACCWLQEATFLVPNERGRGEMMQECWQHFFGERWDCHYWNSDEWQRLR